MTGGNRRLQHESPPPPANGLPTDGVPPADPREIQRPRARFRVYLWWPEDAGDWIHPEDAERVRALIPSTRVFRYERTVAGRDHLRYGRSLIRIRPILFLPVEGDGFLVGDQVEVLSRLGLNRPFVGRIHAMRWEQRQRRIRYFVTRTELPHARGYLAEDLRRVDDKPKLPRDEPTVRDYEPPEGPDAARLPLD